MVEITWIYFWSLIIGCFILGGISLSLVKREGTTVGADGSGRRRMTSQTALYVIMFTIIQLPSVALLSLVSFMIFMAVREIYAAFDHQYPGLSKHPEYYISLTLLPVYPWIALYAKDASVYFFGMFGLSAVLILVLGRRTEKTGVSLLLLLLSLAFCLTFNLFAALRLLPNGLHLCLYLFFLVNMADVMALIAGAGWGKTKLLPAVSPNKTVEGSLGSLLSTILLSWAFCRILELPLSLPESLLAGAAINVLGQLGDLFFSLIKRETKVKDYGALIPGHGGILDRFDSLLMVLPFFTFFLLDLFLR